VAREAIAGKMEFPWKNKLYFGDNLDIMRDYIEDESVDLIYLDPPFNSKATYNVLFKEKNGTGSAAQITAFEDTWHWDISTEEAYREIVQEGPGKLADLVQALRSFLGSNDMMAYLTMMAIRLVEMHRVLKETGSIYLHCDPTASHYLKIVMDAVFSVRGFQNEIVWHYRRYTAASTRFQRLHDILLFYTKGKKHHFNVQLEEYSDKSGKKDSHYQQDEQGNGIGGKSGRVKSLTKFISLKEFGWGMFGMCNI
jgi:site-specific DNA-methyltransferase (adenine-specific)